MSLHPFTVDDVVLPDDLVTSTLAILAKRRVGKSNAAVVLAEELYGAGLPWVAVDPKGDWYGVRSAGDGEGPGLAVPVFGGDHGDVPIEETAGVYLADLIASERLTCVLDTSVFSKAARRRFLTDFAERLYKRNREPLHLFLEECDEYIPQRVMGEDARMVGAFETLVKRGGFRGLGCTLISQRSASVNKDVLTQVETLIALRTTGPQDRKAVADWIDYHDAGKELARELPLLETGQAFLFSPEWLELVQKVMFRRRWTFDSGATPKAGERRVEPKRLADVDLAAIKEAMAETIERAKADDPAELRKEIGRLKSQLHAAVNAQPEPQLIPVVDVEAQKALDSLSSSLDAVRREFDSIRQRYPAFLPTTEKDSSPRVGAAPAGSSAPASAPMAAVSGGLTAESAGKTPRPVPEMRPGPVEGLHATAVRMLTVLADADPLRLTTAQWAAAAHMKHTGGAWNAHLSSLRKPGLVLEHTAGWALTEAGWGQLDRGPARGLSPALLRAKIRDSLSGAGQRIFELLRDTWPQRLSKERIAFEVGMTASGGAFTGALGTLHRNDLIERQGGLYRLAENLAEDL